MKKTMRHIVAMIAQNGAQIHLTQTHAIPY